MTREHHDPEDPYRVDIIATVTNGPHAGRHVGAGYAFPGPVSRSALRDTLHDLILEIRLLVGEADLHRPHIGNVAVYLPQPPETP